MEEFIYDVLNQDRWWWTVGRRSLVRSLTRRHVGSRKHLKVLDIGCGTGTNLATLRDYGTVYGMDVSLRALSYCHDRGIERICRGDAAHLPFQDNSFDVVIGVDVLEHIEDDGGALREIHRVCKPGALLIAVVPAFSVAMEPKGRTAPSQAPIPDTATQGAHDQRRLHGKESYLRKLTSLATVCSC